jgi:AcrR family transcriptional regulator
LELRERKKAVLRDRIVRNAITLFARKGYDEVSLEEIVEASMCSRSTFHRYFGAKEDLLFPGADRLLGELRDALDASVDVQDVWATARRETSACLCGFLDDLDPQLKLDFVRLWFNEQAPRRRYFEVVMEWEEVVQEFFARELGVEVDPSLECSLLAAAVTSALRSALNTAMSSGEDVRSVVTRSFDMVEAGFHPRRPLARPRRAV